MGQTVENTWRARSLNPQDKTVGVSWSSLALPWAMLPSFTVAAGREALGAGPWELDPVQILGPEALT